VLQLSWDVEVSTEKCRAQLGYQLLGGIGFGAEAVL
jgi:hypothetical protein